MDMFTPFMSETDIFVQWDWSMYFLDKKSFITKLISFWLQNVSYKGKFIDSSQD